MLNYCCFLIIIIKLIISINNQFSYDVPMGHQSIRSYLQTQKDS